jgi:hypothetical protein
MNDESLQNGPGRFQLFVKQCLHRICKVKKLFLCLTKYQAMKTYPELNRAPHHEGVLDAVVKEKFAGPADNSLVTILTELLRLLYVQYFLMLNTPF